MSGFGADAAAIYGGWALFLLLGCLGPHLLVVVLYFAGTWRARGLRWFLLVELVYGFVNPVVYLLVFQPALFRQWTPSWLPSICWLGWAAYWGARFFGRDRSIGRWPSRKWASVVLLFAATLITLLFLRDAVVALTQAIITAKPIWEGEGEVVVPLLCLPLYALPALAVSRQLSSARSEEAWKTSDFFLLRLPVWVPATLLFMLALTVAASLQRRSEEEVRALLLRHRETILAVSRERQLEPRLLASIVEVTQRDIDRPFLSGVEEFIADAWLVDSTSGLLLAEAFDPSLGIAQVKANTLLTAYAIHALSNPAEPRHLGSKEYRSTWVMSREELERIPTPALRQVKLPEGGSWPAKRKVVELLRAPETNLAYSAFLLDLVASQWEAANPAWSIRSRPDIMATLFQLGFHHSIPRAEPQANDFGERVQRAFDDPWMQAQFSTDGGSP